jgi:hypothetical protein
MHPEQRRTRNAKDFRSPAWSKGNERSNSWNWGTGGSQYTDKYMQSVTKTTNRGHGECRNTFEKRLGKGKTPIHRRSKQVDTSVSEDVSTAPPSTSSPKRIKKLRIERDKQFSLEGTRSKTRATKPITGFPTKWHTHTHTHIYILQRR